MFLSQAAAAQGWTKQGGRYVSAKKRKVCGKHEKIGAKLTEALEEYYAARSGCPIRKKKNTPAKKRAKPCAPTVVLAPPMVVQPVMVPPPTLEKVYRIREPPRLVAPKYIRSTIPRELIDEISSSEPTDTPAGIPVVLDKTNELFEKIKQLEDSLEKANNAKKSLQEERDSLVSSGARSRVAGESARKRLDEERAAKAKLDAEIDLAAKKIVALEDQVKEETKKKDTLRKKSEDRLAKDQKTIRELKAQLDEANGKVEESSRKEHDAMEKLKERQKYLWETIPQYEEAFRRSKSVIDQYQQALSVYEAEKVELRKALQDTTLREAWLISQGNEIISQNQLKYQQELGLVRQQAEEIVVKLIDTGNKQIAAIAEQVRLERDSASRVQENLKAEARQAVGEVAKAYNEFIAEVREENAGLVRERDDIKSQAIKVIDHVVQYAKNEKVQKEQALAFAQETALFAAQQSKRVFELTEAEKTLQNTIDEVRNDARASGITNLELLSELEGTQQFLLNFIGKSEEEKFEQAQEYEERLASLREKRNRFKALVRPGLPGLGRTDFGPILTIH